MAYELEMANGDSGLSWPAFRTSNNQEIDAVLRSLLGPLTAMVNYVYLRWSAGTRGGTSPEDLLQIVLMTLWGELEGTGETRFKSAKELRNFVFRVLRNQMAKVTPKPEGKGKRVPLPEDVESSSLKVLDELIAAADRKAIPEAVRELQELVARAEKVLTQAIARLSPDRAAAAETWLQGAGYIAAGEAHGLALAKVRRVVRKLGRGDLGYFLKRIRRDLESLYRVSSVEAKEVGLGRLQRLLAPHRARRCKRNDRLVEAQEEELPEYVFAGEAAADHAA